MLGGSEIPKCRIVQVTPDRAYAILNSRYFGASKSVRHWCRVLCSSAAYQQDGQGSDGKSPRISLSLEGSGLGAAFGNLRSSTRMDMARLAFTIVVKAQ